MSSSTSTSTLPTGPLALSRPVQAIVIPAGDRLRLDAGTRVAITQALGGSFTVRELASGHLYRIEAADADALGLDPALASLAVDGAAAGTPGGGEAGAVTEDDVWAKLKTCFDPEIPVNIVDLGLIYSLELFAQPDATTRVAVKMTLTAPGCGMGPTIAGDARQKILGIPGVSEAAVDVVWDPPWNPGLITQAGRDKLGMA